MNKSKSAVDIHRVTRDAYQLVIEDVIQNVQEDFEREGVDESILMELKSIWEKRLAMSGAVPGYVPTTGTSGATTSDDQQQQQQYAAYDSSQHVSNESAYHQQQQQQQQYYSYQAASSSHYDTSSTAAAHHYYSQQQNHEQQHYYATPTSHLTPSSESYDDSSALATPHLNDIGGLQDTFLNYHHQQQQQQQQPVSLPSMHATFAVSLPKQEQLGRPQDKMAPVSNSYNTSLQTFEDPFATPTMKLNEQQQHQQQQHQHQQLDQRRQGVRTTRDDDSFALENQPPTKRARTLDTDQLQQQSYHDNIPQYDGTDSALSALANIKTNEFDDDDEFGDDDEEEEKSEYGALNSDDDVEGDEETNISNFVLSQYEKVTRHKNKWKCTLKYGIMNLNEKDYLFQTATGDFQW